MYQKRAYYLWEDDVRAGNPIKSSWWYYIQAIDIKNRMIENGFIDCDPDICSTCNALAKYKCQTCCAVSCAEHLYCERCEYDSSSDSDSEWIYWNDHGRHRQCYCHDCSKELQQEQLFAVLREQADDREERMYNGF